MKRHRLSLCMASMTVWSAMILLQSGCAFRQESAVITSKPTGAKVYLDGDYTGDTPLPIPFTWSYWDGNIQSPKHVMVEADGYDKGIKVWSGIRFSIGQSMPLSFTHFDLTPLSSARPQPGQAIPSQPRSTKASLDQNVLWRAPRRVRMVIVGITDYNDNAIPRVAYASSDAQLFRSFALGAGVPAENITLLVNEDATRNKITDALLRLKAATTDPSETAIFYFSGHGAPVVEEGKVTAGTLVPHDAVDTSLAFTGVELAMVEETMTGLPGDSIVILDACFTGKQGRGVSPRGVKGLLVVPRNFRIVSAPQKKTWWMAATSGDNSANDFDKAKHGLFTHYLIQALNGERGVDADNNGLVTLREAFDWTKSRVESVSVKSLGRRQVPELAGAGDTILTVIK